MKNEVVLAFSGGIDSLSSALKLCEQFDKVHLLTFQKGYLEFGVHNNHSNVLKLQKLAGKHRFIHKIIDLHSILERICGHHLFSDFRKWGGEIAWCVGCRLAMNIGSLIYALDNDLFYIADGSNRDQSPSSGRLVVTAENFPAAVKNLREFASSCQVVFLTPVYESESREERRESLRKMGFHIDFQSYDHKKSLTGMLHKDFLRRYQPVCLSGWLIHWRRNLFGVPVHHDEKKTVAYMIEKEQRVIIHLVRDHFKQEGIDLDVLLEQRKLTYPL